MLVNYASDGEGRMLMVPAIGEKESNQNVHSKHNLIMLMEGWNMIEEAAWPKVVPHIKDKLDSGEITLYGKKDEAGEIVQCDLHEVRADKARDIVKNCYNASNLAFWTTDTRLSSELRALVDIQIGNIEKAQDVKKD